MNGVFWGLNFLDPEASVGGKGLSGLSAGLLFAGAVAVRDSSATRSRPTFGLPSSAHNSLVVLSVEMWCNSGFTAVSGEEPETSTIESRVI